MLQLCRGFVYKGERRRCRAGKGTVCAGFIAVNAFSAGEEDVKRAREKLAGLRFWLQEDKWHGILLVYTPKIKEGGRIMAHTSASLPTKKRILTVCVKLFLEKGYKKTTLAEIIEKAGVSYSSFQNIFRAKDGVLTELVEFMFKNQFAMARGAAGAKLPPICIYAVETAIQMTLTELNENLREIYIEAYTQEEASEYIHRETAKELHEIFGPYLPTLTAEDFYKMEIGSAGIMRGYMAHPCDETLTLENKLRLFITMSLRAYNVPKEEIEQTIRFVEGLDIRTISEQVMQALFESLAMHFEFSLANMTQPEKENR